MGILYDRDKDYINAINFYEKALQLDNELAIGMHWIDRLLYDVRETPPTIADRLDYLKLQMMLPENDRLMSIIDIDKNQQIASQLKIQSIPAVFAFKDKQIVDAFQGVIPENKIIEFIEKQLGEKLQTDNSLFYESIQIKFEDKELNEKKSYFEVVYASVIKINEEIKDKKDLEKIILCDVQNKIYPNLEKTFLNLLHNSGFPEIKLDKKIDFTQLYRQRSN